MADAHTFLFADLAGFAALTEAHGDERAADLAGDFFGAVRGLLARYGAEEIKVLGDELMLRGDEAESCVRLAQRIVGEVGAQHGFPAIRVGLHTGPATERGGDWFGATVNLAARIASLASGGEILATAATRQAAGVLPEVEWEARGTRSLKNIARPVEVFAVLQRARAPRERELVIDPVCRMSIDPAGAAGQVAHMGVEYHFCSLRCIAAFASNADGYLADAREGG